MRFALHELSATEAKLLLRLAFHDAASFCQETGTGGANGSVRLELCAAGNEGLAATLKLVETWRCVHSRVSLADMLQVQQDTSCAGLCISDAELDLGEWSRELRFSAEGERVRERELRANHQPALISLHSTCPNPRPSSPVCRSPQPRWWRRGVDPPSRYPWGATTATSRLRSVCCKPPDTAGNK
jgi:hypothetical protein